MLCPGCSLAVFAEVLAEGWKRDVVIGNRTPCIEKGDKGLDFFYLPVIPLALPVEV